MLKILMFLVVGFAFSFGLGECKIPFKASLLLGFGLAAFFFAAIFGG